MKIPISLCFAFILFTLVSCSDSNKSTNPGEKLEIFPFSIGNTWTFRIIQIDELSKCDTSVYTLEITTDTVMNGQKYYTAEGWNWMTNKDDGLYFYSSENMTELRGYIYPAKVGDEIIISSNRKRIVEDVNAAVKTQAGTFKCIKYVETWQEKTKGEEGYSYSKVEEYYCPGIGIIKSTEYAEYLKIGEMRVWKSESELTSYKIK